MKEHTERTAITSPPRLARIAQRAHELASARGNRRSTALDDWLQAEREVDAEIDCRRGDGPDQNG